MKCAVAVLALVVAACNIPARSTDPEGPTTALTLTPVRLDGEPYARRLLAATLQGVVNQRGVRLYLLPGRDGPRGAGPSAGSEDATQRQWLDVYERGGSVAIGAEATLDEALRRYASEADGYVVASLDEPWTINVATTRAGLRRWLVATPETAPSLDAVDLRLREDLRGRWSSTDAAVRDTLATHLAEASGLALGALDPRETRLRDWLVAQRLLTVHARPNGDGWPAFLEVLARTARDVPVYGYLSQDGSEEDVAVRAISSAGKRLVPADTTANLSVHAAVPAVLPSPRPVTTASCAAGKLRVALAFSDGDNLGVLFDRYPADGYWTDAARGSFPIGWSVATELGDLAPAAATRYLSERRNGDELVGMTGTGYAYVPLLPDAGPFLSATFGQMRQLGMTSLWLLGPQIGPLDEPTWEKVASGYRQQIVRGALAGYGGGTPNAWRTLSGMPVLRARGSYDFGAEDIEDRIRAALAEFRRGGPSVLLVNVTAWTVDLRALAGVAARLRSEPDLELVTPTQALACS